METIGLRNGPAEGASIRYAGSTNSRLSILESAMDLRCTLACILISLFCGVGFADDPVFSGPQAGEPLVPLKVLAVHGDDAGKEVDPVAAADGKPTLMVFVHKKTRPGLALALGITRFATTLEGTAATIIWLDDDKAAAENYLTGVAKSSLQFAVPVGISLDGGEGPGAYGLNRNVELTIIVADDNKVVSNFALVQPSVTEGPAIVGELAKLVGKEPPTMEEFQSVAYAGRGRMANRNREKMKKPGSAPVRGNALRELMRKVIAADASESDLRAAVKAIESWVGEDKGRQMQLGRMAGMVLERGMGSPMAKKQIKTWHEEYGQNDE